MREYAYDIDYIYSLQIENTSESDARAQNSIFT